MVGRECDKSEMGGLGGFRLARVENARWLVRNDASGRTFLVELPVAVSDGRAVGILKALLPKLSFLYEAQRPTGEVLDVRPVGSVYGLSPPTPGSHYLCTTYSCMCSPGMGVSYVFHDDRLVAVRRTGWARKASGNQETLYEQLELRTLQVVFGMLSTLERGNCADM